MRRSLRLLAVLSLLGLACCHRGRQSRRALAPELPIYVVVENHNWAQVRVYALNGGTRMRIGSVVSNRTQRFEIPPGLRGGAPTVQFSVNPLATEEVYITDELSVWPGDTVYLTVENQLSLSSASVYGS